MPASHQSNADHDADSRLRLALGLWLAITLVCAGLAVSKPHSHTIYPIFSFVGGEWAAGRDIHVLLPGYDYYRYSPTLAAFFVLWQPLGDGWGGAVWRLLGMTLLVSGLLSWARHVWQRRRPTEQIGLWLLMITPMLLQNVHNGQSNPHMLGLLLLGTADATAGRLWRSAIWFGGAILIKPYVVAIPALIALSDRRLIPRLAVALAVGLAVPFLTQSPDYVVSQYANWFHHLSGNDRSTLPLREAFRDYGLLFRAYLTALPPMVLLGISATAGLGMARAVWVDRTLRRSRAEKIGGAFALGSCWITVLGPATEGCTYLLLAPALVARLLARPGASGWWLRISYALFVGTIAASMFPQEWRVQVWGPQPVAGLLFLSVVAADYVVMPRHEKLDQSAALSAAA